MIRFQIFFDVDVYEVELYKSTLFSFSPRSIFVGQNSWFLMQFVRFWEARGAWISMEKAHQTHHKHAKAPQTFYVDVQLWCKAVQVIFVAIMRHGVEFWMLDTQNFNFLKKMKTAPNGTFHPKTFIYGKPNKVCFRSRQVLFRISQRRQRFHASSSTLNRQETGSTTRLDTYHLGILLRFGLRGQSRGSKQAP